MSLLQLTCDIERCWLGNRKGSRSYHSRGTRDDLPGVHVRCRCRRVTNQLSGCAKYDNVFNTSLGKRQRRRYALSDRDILYLRGVSCYSWTRDISCLDKRCLIYCRCRCLKERQFGKGRCENTRSILSVMMLFYCCAQPPEAAVHEYGKTADGVDMWTVKHFERSPSLKLMLRDGNRQISNQHLDLAGSLPDLCIQSDERSLLCNLPTPRILMRCIPVLLWQKSTQIFQDSGQHSGHKRSRAA